VPVAALTEPISPPGVENTIAGLNTIKDSAGVLPPIYFLMIDCIQSAKQAIGISSLIILPSRRDRNFETLSFNTIRPPTSFYQPSTSNIRERIQVKASMALVCAPAFFKLAAGINHYFAVW
jgi:hypothetical protein